MSNDDGARLRIYALEKRMSHVERDSRTVKTWMLVLAGLVVAGVIVGALELRHIVHFIERIHGWRS
jgi:hypothetical protein